LSVSSNTVSPVVFTKSASRIRSRSVSAGADRFRFVRRTASAAATTRNTLRIPTTTIVPRLGRPTCAALADTGAAIDVAALRSTALCAAVNAADLEDSVSRLRRLRSPRKSAALW
jgi:hypothetical protein